jgi:predicted RNA binding protein YcfA (HicA-like mRNA interferase family)
MPGLFRNFLATFSKLLSIKKYGMGKLANISGKDAVKAFECAGWQLKGQVGSHAVLTKSGMRVNLSVPQHKELSTGTLRALIRAAGMTVDQFLCLL